MTRAGNNVVLIGMAGVGKSTLGVLLAKVLSRGFVDTDIVIQSAEGKRLQDLIDALGVDAFNAIEERHILALHETDTVIATGGSVVYSSKAMTHLKSTGTVIHLDLPLSTLQERITNMDSRGIVMGREQTFEALYAERRPLYFHWADATVDCSGLSHEGAVAAVLSALRDHA